MRKLPAEARARILHLLCEGQSIRADWSEQEHGREAMVIGSTAMMRPTGQKDLTSAGTVAVQL